MENQNYIAELYRKYINNSCSKEELREFLNGVEDETQAPLIAQIISEELKNDGGIYAGMPVVNSIISKLDVHIENNILQVNGVKPNFFNSVRIQYWWAAAAIIVVLSVIIYKGSNKPGILRENYSVYKNDVRSGADKAYLTLANGKKILLSDNSRGVVNPELGTELVSKGILRYLVPNSKKTAIGYNSISTPNGGKFQVVLSDGTVVRLNASSVLRFPAYFDDRSARQVELVGEGYFEVSHRNNQPFFVRSGKQLLRVLGTHFNINAYQDEKSIRTTLSQGMVSISTPKGTAVELRPGQQASFENDRFSVVAVDTTVAMDWLRGEINLKEESLQAIMRKIERWYDVEVVFTEDAPVDLRLGGLISREKSLVTLLKVMELTNKVHFKVDGRRVTVMK